MLLVGILLLIACNGCSMIHSGNDNSSQAASSQEQSAVNPDGKIRILYCGDDTGAEETAAELLAEVIVQASGVDCTTVRTDSAADAEPGDILLGTISGEDVSALGTEGYRIKSEGDRIVITGGKSRGVMYGAVKFLEKYFGYRQYTKTLSKINHPRNMVRADEVEDEEYIPPFEYRETDWLTTDYNNETAVYEAYSAANFRVANGLNGGFSYAQIPQNQGYMFGYYETFTHTMNSKYINADKYFSEHPEWFALRDGGRQRDGQLCLSNAEMRARLIEEVLVHCAVSAGAYEGQPFLVAVTQSDNQKYCECAECTTIAEQYGGQSGLMLWFINQVAEAVEKEYPQALIDTFAYQYTQRAPTGIRPRHNVVVRFAPLSACCAHALHACPGNMDEYTDIKAWSELIGTDGLHGRLYIWCYSTNYSHYNSVFPNFESLKEHIQTYYKLGVKGIYVQGNHQAYFANSEFAELRGYLISRLLFNPGMSNEEYDSEMKGFLAAYYGAGDKNVYDFIHTTLNRQADSADYLSVYTDPTDILQSLTPQQVEDANSQWDEALKATASDAFSNGNVKRSWLSWRFWLACNNVYGYNSKEAKEALYDELTSNQNILHFYGESRLLKEKEDIDFNQSPTSWVGGSPW